MEFNPSYVRENVSKCIKCDSDIDIHYRYFNQSGVCHLCRIKPFDKCYCDYESQKLVFSCPKCKLICQRCFGIRVHYFNERKWKGSGKTKNWVKSYNLNKPFIFTFEKRKYYPQDICDKCIDFNIGWIWANYDLENQFNIFYDH